jgi:hypothetical protein
MEQRRVCRPGGQSMLTPQANPSHRGGRSKQSQRKLSSLDVTKICSLLESWPSRKITWDLVVEHIESYIGHRWTRQALEKHERIKTAYQTRRTALRTGGAPGRPASVDPADILLRRRVEELQAEIGRLRAQIATYEDLFIRHHYNAHARGVSEGELAAPLPPIDRGQTDAR